MKEKYIPKHYYRRTADIQGEKQIAQMFSKLDTDGSKAISMQEMQELFSENGIEMTLAEIAEMFSIVKKINDAEWLNKSGAKHAYAPKKPYMQTLEDKMKLQLSMEDFKMVTERTEALRRKFPVPLVDQLAS